jgi:hypothetical protein
MSEKIEVKNGDRFGRQVATIFAKFTEIYQENMKKPTRVRVIN